MSALETLDLSPLERDVQQLIPVRPAAFFVRRPFRAAATLVSNLIGPALLQDKAAETTPAADSKWIVLLCLNCSIALFLIAAGHGAGRRGEADAAFLFWSGVILLLLPIASRIASPVLSRGERLFLLLLLTECLFLYKLFYAPTSFVQFDEFLHWITAQDILYRHKLFLSNSLLPISPFYPGLEILTTAQANLAGLSLFPASVLIIAVLRTTFVCALFLFFEKISESSRLAALACLVYMGCSSFAVFDAQFAYESLGLVLCVLIMLAEAEAAKLAWQKKVGALALIVMLQATLAVTHHASAFWCALYLGGLAVLETVRRTGAVPASARIGVAVVAVSGVLLPLLWNFAMGDPVSHYLGPIVENGVAGLLDKLNGSSSARKLFVAADGTVQPIGYQIVGIGSTLLIAIGLATGFFRSLALAAETPATSGWARLLRIAKLKWRDSRIVLLTLAAFGFPVSVAFRLTASGWEIGNRTGSFVFLSVGLVVAVSIVYFWQSHITRWRLIATNLAIGIILLGGITTGSGIQAVHGKYRVAADPDSIEPMGIGAAVWAKTWLGAGNKFAADRVNRTLLAGYGQQDVVTSIADRLDDSRIFLADGLSPDVLYPIKAGKLDYLLVDLRVTTAPAVLGHYFEETEPGHGSPPPPSALLKFDADKKVARIFDNGWIVIFDVRALHDRE